MSANLDLGDVAAGNLVAMIELTDLRAQVVSLKSEVVKLNARLEKAEKDAECKQAKIDSLMLEYCPDEMTSEQIEEWGRNQRPVSTEEEAAINIAIAKEPK